MSGAMPSDDGPGSRAPHEAAGASSPKASIPIAVYGYETIVFRFDTIASRHAFFDKYFPGNPFKGELLPSVRVTAMSLCDVMSEADLYEEALETIAGGEGDPGNIATEALEKAEAARNAEIAQGIAVLMHEDREAGFTEGKSPVAESDAPKGFAP